ncbi:hypothetical protein [Microvirga mediterraneensis]|uniref:DUF4185 domain-containing protein n=1 Tax=Microvirga mediterraneensis TaxID=2754695 RepID=A0A838BH05_9HYPH|nr:hypothetical protein [Microvirga mediterraneensis]MBA1154525.1 hypothetical protein [Microvirga mediterraneensis]
MRMGRWNALAWPALLLMMMSRSVIAGEELRFSVSPEPEVVYSYERQRCDWRTIPDSPARAYRRRDGSLALIAAHFRNRVLEGSNFDDLRTDCSLVSQGEESADPAALNDRFWIQSLIPLEDGRVLGLASQEFSGLRHDGLCAKGLGKPECWYLSLVALEANERDFSFTLLPRERRLVAGSNKRFDTGTKAAGFLTLSNTVFDGEHAYFIAWTEDAAEPGGRGNCLFRAPRSDLVTGWRMMSAGRFVYPPNPYPVDGQKPIQATCDRLGNGDITGKVRSLVRLESRKLWMVVWSTRVDDTGGVYYATSPDLRNWSPAALLAPFDPPWGSTEKKAYYDYPSIIDHDSPSPVFQTAGRTFYLYLTRFNWQAKRPTMNRDLVRFKVTLD